MSLMTPRTFCSDGKLAPPWLWRLAELPCLVLIVLNHNLDPSKAMAGECLARCWTELISLREINCDLKAKLRTEQDVNNKKYKMYEERVETLKAHLAAQAKLLVTAQNEMAKLSEQGENMVMCFAREFPTQKSSIVKRGLETESKAPCKAKRQIEQQDCNKVDPCLKTRSQSLKLNSSISTPSSSGTHVNDGSSWLGKPFPCPISECHRRFANKACLKKHVAAHADHQQLSCEFKGCKRRFPNQQALQRHVWRHTGEKLLPCKFTDCRKRFVAKDTLHVHMLTHTGKKPFVCHFEGCERRFPSKPVFERHIFSMHTADRQLKCTFYGCSRTAFSKYELRRHTAEHVERLDSIRQHISTTSGDSESENAEFVMLNDGISNN